MDLLVNGELGRLLESLVADGTREGFLLNVSFLVGHELGGVGEVAVTNITGKQGVLQDALFVFCRVVQLQVTLLALVVAKDNVALNALQGHLRCYGKTERDIQHRH